MSPLVWDLAHIGQQEELWLLRGGDLGPAGPARRPTSTRCTTRSSTGGPTARRCRCCRPVEARAFNHEVRGRVLDLLERTPERATCSPRAWSCSTRSSTTRPCSPPCSCGRDRPSCWNAGRCRRAGRVARRARARGRAARSCSASTPPTSRSRSTTSAPRTPWTSAPFWIGRVPVTNAAVARVHRRRRLRRGRELWSDRGWAHRVAGRPGAARVLDRRRHPAPVRDRGGRAAGRAGPARLLLRGRGVRAPGRGARLPTEIEWEKACAWDPATPGPARPGRGARPRPTPERGQPRRLRRCARPRSAPTRRARRPTASSS